MADRSIVVTLKAVVSDFQQKFQQAGKAAGDLADRVEKSQQTLGKLSGIATAGGVAIAAGLGFAAKAAIDWESAWAGVKKTVDGSDAQLKQLEGSLREMARTMPATHSEIAAVAEAAGQLGVATEDVAGFAKTMIMLGETTNLSADEAATAIAQIQNITGMAAGDVDRFAATLVKLGNNGASTEAEILALSNRIAGAANIVGLAEKDLLALSNAMASAGIQAELGGSAMSRALIGMNSAVLDGGEKLEAFAEISGMSAGQFASAWRSAPVTAVEAFVRGLSRINSEGGNTAAALGDVGLKGTQNTQVFLALAGASDMLSESIAMAGGEWESSGALLAEYEQRLKTTEAQIQIAWNNIKDAAITAGGALLPAIAGMAQGVASLAQAFGSIPAPVQGALTGFTALAAGSLLAIGGLAKLASTVMDLRGTLAEVSKSFPGATGAMKGFGAAAIGATVITTALSAAFAHQNAELDKLAPSAERVRGALLDLAKGGAGLEIGETFRTSAGYADNLGEALMFLERQYGSTADGASQFGEALMGFFANVIPGARSGAEVIATSLGRIDAELASMKPEHAAAAFRELSKQWDMSKVSAEALMHAFPQYANSIQQLANETGYGVMSAQELADAMGGKLPPAMQKALTAAAQADPQVAALAKKLGLLGDEADGAGQSLLKVAGAMLKLAGAEIGLEAAMDAATEAIAKNGKTATEHGAQLDITTEKGRANKESLMGIASAYMELTNKQIEGSASAQQMADSQARAVGEFIAAAEAAGLTREAAAKLAAQWGLIPESVATQISAPGANLTQQEIEDVTRAAKLVPRSTEAKVSAPGARPSKADVDAFVWSMKLVPGLTTAQIKTIAELYGVEQAKRAIDSVSGKTVTVAVNYMARGDSNVYRTATGAIMRASGGPVYGAGTTTSDSIPAWLSNREFVHTAASHDYYGSALMWAINRKQIPKEWFASLGFAGGGSPSAPAPVHYAPNYSPPATYQRMPAQAAPSVAQIREAMAGMPITGRLTLQGSEAWFEGHYDRRQTTDLRRQRAHTG